MAVVEDKRDITRIYEFMSALIWYIDFSFYKANLNWVIKPELGNKSTHADHHMSFKRNKYIN